MSEQETAAAVEVTDEPTVEAASPAVDAPAADAPSDATEPEADATASPRSTRVMSSASIC